MGRKIDLGGYFEQLTRKAPGGRRVREAVDAGRRRATRVTARVRERARGRGAATPGRRGLPDEGVVHVEYSPQLDGDPDPGEVVWTWVPFEEDPSQGKDRPVLVIGRRGTQLVGVPLTTKRDEREAQIALGTGSWDPKRRESYARIWRMLDLDPAGMRREGSILDPDRFQDVVAAVDRYYDVRRAPATSRRAAHADPDD